ncbi:MAG: hypothetical protein HQL27_05050 [Candidatus Omnitrophica bacterium]|nr:hypothetical protein [Candidatus Omnitrophota bacterium]
MLRKLIKNKKAQNTAEYAILISLVVAGIIAMQTYAQRALQARVRDASSLMTSTKGPAGFQMNTTVQYEPYYLSSQYNISDDNTKTERQDGDTIAFDDNSVRVRAEGGSQTSSYNADAFGEAF